MRISLIWQTPQIALAPAFLDGDDRKKGRERKGNKLTSDDLGHRHDQTHTHDPTPKTDAQDRGDGLPALARQPEVAERRQDVGQGARARGADQLKHRAQIAGDEADADRAQHQRRGEDEVAVRLVGLLREPVVVHHLPAHEALEGQGSEHVEAEAEARDVDQDVVGGEVVEHVALGQGAEAEEAGQSHAEAGEHADAGAVMRYEGKAVDRWSAEGAVDQQRVVVADECWLAGEYRKGERGGMLEEFYWPYRTR